MGKGILVSAALTLALCVVVSCSGGSSDCAAARDCAARANEAGQGGEAAEGGSTAGAPSEAGSGDTSGVNGHGGGVGEAAGAPGEAGMGGGSGGARLTTIKVVDAEDQHLVSGATVLVNDADGALVSETMTDASGSVNVLISEGQTVSAAFAKGYTVNGALREARMLNTVLDIQPGASAVLTVSDPGNFATTQPSPMSVTVTLTTTLTEIGSYREISLSCAGGTSVLASAPTYTFDNFTGCKGRNTFDVYGVVTLANGLHGFAAQYDVPFKAGASATIHLVADDPNFSTFKLHAGPIPSGSEQIDFDVFASRTEGVAGYDLSDHADSSPPGVDETLMVELPIAGFASFRVQGFVELSKSPYVISSWLTRTGPTASAERDWAPVDDIAIFQPNPSVDASDVSRPRLSWSLANTGKLGDAVNARLGWGGTGWSVILPPARVGSVKLPVLPDDLSAWRPKVGDTFGYSFQHIDVIEVIDYSDYLVRYADLGTDNANGCTLQQ